jgi:ABC-2 type transport system permease protein
MVRLGVGTVPTWHFPVSMGVLLLSIAVGMNMAIKVFRLYMSVSGKRPKLGEIAKSLREA